MNAWPLDMPTVLFPLHLQDPLTGEIDKNCKTTYIWLWMSISAELMDDHVGNSYHPKVLRTVSTFNTGMNYSYELLTFLKGSKKSKLKVWHDNPELHAYFQGKSEHLGGNSSCGCYWKVHVDLLLPTWVPPPLYQKGRPVSPPTWYHEGPSVMQLPLPKVDIHTDHGEICRCHS